MYGIYSTKLAFKSELQGSHSVVSCLSRSCIDSVTRTTKSCLTSFLQFELEIEVFVFVQIRPNVVLTLFTGSNSTPDGAPIPLLTKSQLKSLQGLMKPRRSFYILFVMCSFCHSPPILPILVPFSFTLIFFKFCCFQKQLFCDFSQAMGGFPSKIS